VSVALRKSDVHIMGVFDFRNLPRVFGDFVFAPDIFEAERFERTCNTLSTFEQMVQPFVKLAHTTTHFLNEYGSSIHELVDPDFALSENIETGIQQIQDSIPAWEYAIESAESAPELSLWQRQHLKTLFKRCVAALLEMSDGFQMFLDAIKVHDMDASALPDARFSSANDLIAYLRQS